MTEYVDVTPSPAVIVAHNCTEALKREGVPMEFEGQVLVTIAETLTQLEYRGVIVFTDVTAPNYETSRPATSAEMSLGAALREMVASISDPCIEDAPFWERSENEIAEAQRRLRKAVGAAENALGF